jgi:hypothetical protein
MAGFPQVFHFRCAARACRERRSIRLNQASARTAIQGSRSFLLTTSPPINPSLDDTGCPAYRYPCRSAEGSGGALRKPVIGQFVRGGDPKAAKQLARRHPLSPITPGTCGFEGPDGKELIEHRAQCVGAFCSNLLRRFEKGFERPEYAPSRTQMRRVSVHTNTWL